MSHLARPLAPHEERLLAAARLHAVHALMPYVATALFRLRPWAVDGLGTFGVDAAWRLYVDPEVLAAWGVRAAAGVLLHEVGHALRDDAGAAQRMGPELDRHAWNLCADAAINDDLVACGVELPGRPVLPSDLHDRVGRPLRPGGTAWSYYGQLPVVHVARADELSPRAPGVAADGAVVAVAGAEDEPPTAAAASCGEVAGGVRHDVVLPPGADAAQEVSEAEQRLVRRAVASDVATAVGRGRGTVPLGLRRWADAELSPPTVPWQQQLRGAVRRGVAHAAGAVDTTYARPSRRRVPGVVLPGTRRPVPSVAVVVDTSGSMDDERLTAVLAEVEGIARATGASGQRLRVVTVDAAVQGVRSVTSARQLELAGGGGTDLAPGLLAAVDVRPAPDVVVVLTDGWTPWPATAPRATTRWVVAMIDAEEHTPAPPAWATVVHVGAAVGP